MPTWEMGVELGRALEQLKGHESRLSTTETAVREVRAEVTSLKSMLLRGALLLALWIAGVGGHLSAEQVGETLAATIKALRK